MRLLARLFAVLPVLLALGLASAALAQGWSLEVQDSPRGPGNFVVVDKGRQELYLFRQHSPLSLASKLACSTGQVPGDKYSEGDLRTPEGVYFIQRRLSSGLDYDLYGAQAFTLNFPNPVDILKGKTGSGIWIHGRGHPITPLETKGCIALNDPDLDDLSHQLSLGLPALIAQDVNWREGETQSADETTEALAGMVQAWAKSWESKSEEFFDFYQPEKFSQTTGEPFSAFAGHKRGLFERLPWIQVMVDDIRVIPGPDYWVAYFGQFYRSPFLVSEGVKRLYWQRDDQGRLRIVGREWERVPLGLSEVYLTKSRHEVEAMLDQWRKAWQEADLESYMSFYAPNADQQERASRRAIAEQKREIWAKSPPKEVIVKDIHVELHNQGLRVEFVQEYAGENGYQDTGRKTLVLIPSGGEWRIASEEWRAM